MRRDSIEARAALADRMTAQLTPEDPAAEMPPYLESFLAHLRLLVGVPFEYLVPDARLLPQESIRFFYLDRSWSDRLVDGALAVGKLGSREQAHHHAQHPQVRARLDATERAVRPLQRGRKSFDEARSQAGALPPAPDGRITGFLLRSALVSGWPQMDVRAFDAALAEPMDPAAAQEHRLRTLRLERLSPSVLLALFDGTPELVVLEEPHQGVQLGVTRDRSGFAIRRRDAHGGSDPAAPLLRVPVRRDHPRVLGVAALRERLHALGAQQRGSADLVVQLLAPPWRQRFDHGRPSTGTYTPVVAVAERIADPEVRNALEGLLR
jgi:hypothetical protein